MLDTREVLTRAPTRTSYVALAFAEHDLWQAHTGNKCVVSVSVTERCQLYMPSDTQPRKSEVNLKCQVSRTALKPGNEAMCSMRLD